MSRTLDFSRLTILVVEDEIHTRKLITRMLREIGLRAIGEQSNGKDGLMEVVRTRPDMILCDIHMAPMNGLQFLKGLRTIKVPGINKTPLIFLTADASIPVIEAAMELEISGYLVKPVSIAKLRERLETLVRENKPLLDRALGLVI